MQFFEVSVPIRGLFNLTVTQYNRQLQNVSAGRFPSPSGDYLI